MMGHGLGVARLRLGMADPLLDLQPFVGRCAPGLDTGDHPGGACGRPYPRVTPAGSVSGKYATTKTSKTSSSTTRARPSPYSPPSRPRLSTPGRLLPIREKQLKARLLGERFGPVGPAIKLTDTPPPWLHAPAFMP